MKFICTAICLVMIVFTVLINFRIPQTAPEPPVQVQPETWTCTEPLRECSDIPDAWEHHPAVYAEPAAADYSWVCLPVCTPPLWIVLFLACVVWIVIDRDERSSESYFADEPML